jgi:dihydroorotate dehydrogenase (fumarate)
MFMKLDTTYLGLSLSSPIVPSASPLAEDIDRVKKMEDAGAAAIVLPSLFEEQLAHDQIELHHHTEFGTESFAEALTYFPDAEEFHVGPDGYLNHIRKSKEQTDVPIIASLNGASIGGWIDFAKQISQAGADALELNIYRIPSDINTPGSVIEDETVDIVRSVSQSIDIPVAVKISPFYSNIANMAKRLEDAGAKGLVMFNRFYQPDIDLEALEVAPNVLLSTPQAMRLPLRWVAILYGRIGVDMAATSGVHTSDDAVKLLMAGATVTMMASSLFRNGIEHLGVVKQGLVDWLVENEYESLNQLRGSMSQQHSPNPSEFERAQYTKAVSTIPAQFARQYGL